MPMSARGVAQILALLLTSCATTRAITYPSPCSDTDHCQLVGYEVWGTGEDDVRDTAEGMCDDDSQQPHITYAEPQRDYGVVRCDPKGKDRVLVEVYQ